MFATYATYEHKQTRGADDKLRMVGKLLANGLAQMLSRSTWIAYIDLPIAQIHTVQQAPFHDRSQTLMTDSTFEKSKKLLSVQVVCISPSKSAVFT